MQQNTMMTMLQMPQSMKIKPDSMKYRLELSFMLSINSSLKLSGEEKRSANEQPDCKMEYIMMK